MRILLAFALIAGLAAAAPAKPKAKKDRAAAGYVGTEACLVCHEDMGKAFLKTRHGSIEKDSGRGWQGQSCESCHGPGQKHGEAAEAKFILNHAKASPREVDTSCLTCHKNQATHAGRLHGSHSAGQVGCTSCHSVHHAEPKPKPVSDQCATCHRDVTAQFLRPHTHALTKDAVSCVDCHNPHGTLRSAGLRGTARTRNNGPGITQDWVPNVAAQSANFPATTPTNPYLVRFRLQERPKITLRSTASMSARRARPGRCAENRRPSIAVAIALVGPPSRVPGFGSNVSS